MEYADELHFAGDDDRISARNAEPLKRAVEYLKAKPQLPT